MSTDVQIAASGPPASGRPWLPRFPAHWAVESARAERIFARLLWLLVPLQYYVVTHMVHGLSSDDLIPAVALSLMSVVAIFILSSIAAWFAALVRPPDPGQGDTLTGRVRMWVVALMICTAGSYLLLALSLAATYIAFQYNIIFYIDLVTDRLIWLLQISGIGYDREFDGPLMALSDLVYAVAALLVILLARRVLRGAASPATPQEPGAISVCLMVAAVMTAANYAATLN